MNKIPSFVPRLSLPTKSGEAKNPASNNTSRSTTWATGLSEFSSSDAQANTSKAKGDRGRFLNRLSKIADSIPVSAKSGTKLADQRTETIRKLQARVDDLKAGDSPHPLGNFVMPGRFALNRFTSRGDFKEFEADLQDEMIQHLEDQGMSHDHARRLTKAEYTDLCEPARPELAPLAGKRLQAMADHLKNIHRKTVEDCEFRPLSDCPELPDHLTCRTPASKKGYKLFEKDLKNHLASHVEGRPGMTPAKADLLAKAEFSKANVAYLNRQPWDRIRASFVDRGKTYVSELTPAHGINLSDRPNGRSVFSKDYEGQGICCGTSTELEHAPNLWISEFSEHASMLPEFSPTGGAGGGFHTGIALFRGVRHSICSPYGEEDEFQRKTGAENRAKEVVTAALCLDKEALKDAMKNGKTIDLKLSSTSLVTVFDALGQTEGTMFRDQRDAWERMAAKQPMKLVVHDENGQPRTVSVNLHAAVFNFGVNEAAVKRGRVGWKDADASNEKGLKMMLGDNLAPLKRGEKPGGWVGEYLARQPEPANARQVRVLDEQVRSIWKKQAHHNDGGDPYKLAQRIALLTHEIGAAPCYNCKSGKDRTAMLECEIKREAIHMHRTGQPSKVGKLDLEQQRVFGKVLLQSGNREIQQLNTGVEGNKVIKADKGWLARIRGSLSIQKDRIADPFVIEKAKGGSDVVKA